MNKVLIAIWIVNSLLITLLLIKVNIGTDITVNHIDKDEL